MGSSETSMRPAMMAPAIARTETGVPAVKPHAGCSGSAGSGGTVCGRCGALVSGIFAARMVCAARRSASMEPSIAASC